MKDALLMLGMGGPDSIDAIEPFLKNLFADRDVIDMHVGNFMQGLIAGKIAKKRAVKVAPLYQIMGGATPQLKHTNDLMIKVAEKYQKDTGRDIDGYVGMCYWHPFISDSIKSISEHKYDNIYLFPLYPQYSYTTTGACLKRVSEALKNINLNGKINIIEHYSDNSSFNAIIAKRIAKASGIFNNDYHLLFSAHSLPLYTIKKGDKYTVQLLEQINDIVNMVKPPSYSISYQSKVGPVKWISPSTVDEIKKLSSQGIKNVVIYAISFVNDHIETLIEIDKDMAQLSKELGINLIRGESLNASDDFADIITKILTMRI